METALAWTTSNDWRKWANPRLAYADVRQNIFCRSRTTAYIVYLKPYQDKSVEYEWKPMKDDLPAV